ncbi:ParB/RepB/Spo0J family partition protein, partial [Escherichia coli]
GYEIVVGERRFRAAKEAKLKEIPAVVRDLTEEEMMELSVIENLQREDLSPLEEAESYQFLMKKLGLTQAKLA